MHRRSAWAVAAASLLLGLCPARGAEDPSPAEARKWGAVRGGLCLSARAAGPWLIGADLSVDVALRNAGREPAALPDGTVFFVYVLVAQGDRVIFTQRAYLARGWDAWPGRLDPGQTIALPPLRLAESACFGYVKGLALVDGYPSPRVAGGAPPVAAGVLSEVADLGPAKVHCVAYLPVDGGEGTTLKGRVLRVAFEVGDFDRLTPDRRETVLAKVAAQMRRDAFQAQTAHGAAVRIGMPAVPLVREVVGDASAPDFARMWSLTALGDIGPPDAGAVFRECLADRSAAVNHTAAYHGLKLRDPEFDRALEQAAVFADRPSLSAWAVMGYLRHRDAVPPAVMTAVVKSGDAHIRLALVRTISGGGPDGSHVPVLECLAGDADKRVRDQARAVLEKLGHTAPAAP